MDQLQYRVGRWAAQTFPQATHGSIVAHMRRELDELAQAQTVDEIGEECADVLLMLLHIADRTGFVLEGYAERKFDAVQSRQWGAPDAEGVVEHVREPAP